MVPSKEQMKGWMQGAGLTLVLQGAPRFEFAGLTEFCVCPGQHRNWALTHPVASDGKVGPVPAVTPGSGSASELATAGDVSQFLN